MPSAMLVIEVDGDTHASTVDADLRRTEFLEAQGWRILRFTNAEVVGNIDGVLLTVEAYFGPSPDLASRGHPLP